MKQLPAFYDVKLTDDDKLETTVTNDESGTSCKIIFRPAGGSQFKLLEVKPIVGEVMAPEDLLEGNFTSMDNLYATVFNHIDPSWKPNLADMVVIRDSASKQFEELAQHVSSNYDEYYHESNDENTPDAGLNAQIMDDGSLRFYVEGAKTDIEYIVAPGDWKFTKRYTN